MMENATALGRHKHTGISAEIANIVFQSDKHSIHSFFFAQIK